MENLSSNKKCENCGTLITQKYGSGRFCSEHCARNFSTKSKRKEINQKVSKTLKNKWKSGEILPTNKQQEQREKWLNAVQAMARKNHEEHLKRNVVLGCKEERIELDITYGELEEYRKTHPVCEICGRPERAIISPKGKISELAIDHQHNTNHFRGCLCLQCNIGLGYYEKFKEKIESYLKNKNMAS